MRSRICDLWRTWLTVAFLLSPGVSAAASGSDFDFYVLALSWSPGYCATHDNPSREQCSLKRGFTVHGLWPQYERGYPKNCRSQAPRWLAERVISDNRDLFPARSLAIHQWRKHGRCAGLSQSAYFEKLRAAVAAIRIPDALKPGRHDRRWKPDDLEADLVAANRGLAHEGLSVQCRDGYLTEIRICLTKDLAFRRCDEVDRDSCRARSLVAPDMQ